MDQRPGTVFDASIPDYNSDITANEDAENIQKCVACRTSKVLVLGGSRIDCNCLPIFPDLHDGAYVPVGDVGYVNPLLMHRISYKRFGDLFSILPRSDYRELQEHIQSMYKLGIDKGCQKVFWADAPTNESNGPVYILKKRPVLRMQSGLHFPLTTNHGTYSSPGPTILVKHKPGKVSFVPIFLPKHLFSEDSPEVLPVSDKSCVQNHLLCNLPKVFTNPF